MNGKSDALYAGAFDTGCRVSLDMGACGIQEVAFFHQHSDGVDWVFVDHPSYHRAGGYSFPVMPLCAPKPFPLRRLPSCHRTGAAEYLHVTPLIHGLLVLNVKLTGPNNM